MQETVASYSLLIMHKDRIWAVRDSYGNRPLCIGKLLPADAVTGKKFFIELANHKYCLFSCVEDMVIVLYFPV